MKWDVWAHYIFDVVVVIIIIIPQLWIFCSPITFFSFFVYYVNISQLKNVVVDIIFSKVIFSCVHFIWFSREKQELWMMMMMKMVMLKLKSSSQTTS